MYIYIYIYIFCFLLINKTIIINSLQILLRQWSQKQCHCEWPIKLMLVRWSFKWSWVQSGLSPLVVSETWSHVHSWSERPWCSVWRSGARTGSVAMTWSIRMVGPTWWLNREQAPCRRRWLHCLSKPLVEDSGFISKTTCRIVRGWRLHEQHVVVIWQWRLGTPALLPILQLCPPHRSSRTLQSQWRHPGKVCHLRWY